MTRDLGVLDSVHLAFTELERPESGTGVFANPNPGTSDFFISGSIVDSGKGFQGTLSGTVCTNEDYKSAYVSFAYVAGAKREVALPPSMEIMRHVRGWRSW